VTYQRLKLNGMRQPNVRYASACRVLRIDSTSFRNEGAANHQDGGSERS
jgi:hypothetical protein